MDQDVLEVRVSLRVLGALIYGLAGAALSLLVNIVGASLEGLDPLEIVRVYLSFPLGESALTLETGPTMSLGVLLYLTTGAILGSTLYVILRTMLQSYGFARRLLAVSVLCVAMWIVNYYVLLSWIQPLIGGGRWIIETVPWWLGAVSHLVLGWTVVLLDAPEIFGQSVWGPLRRA